VTPLFLRTVDPGGRMAVDKDELQKHNRIGERLLLFRNAEEAGRRRTTRGAIMAGLAASCGKDASRQLRNSGRRLPTQEHGCRAFGQGPPIGDVRQHHSIPADGAPPWAVCR
jgi:hypothetical protein